jgi:polyphenol oxidase
MIWRQERGVRWLQADLGDGAVAAFSTRLGGVSDPPFESLNLGLLTGDDAASVRENRRRLASAVGLEVDRVVIGRQVHGAVVASHAGPQAPAPFAAAGHEGPEVDGHHTDADRLGLLVFVADCLPIALAGAGGVAMLHGGWRGLAAGIVKRGVAVSAASAAAIGPGIGPCCYEVGGEVLAAFEDLGAGVAAGPMLDLREVARRLLAAAGVERIEISEHCTRCERSLFFSHRGEGPTTGRQAGLVWRTG